MIRLGSPWWLLLGIAVVVRIALLVRDHRARTGAFGFSSLSLVREGVPFRARIASFPFILECAAMLLLVVALARPQRVTRMATSDRYGIDIVVCLDSSGSMAAEDFRPRNRFSVAKELIGDFIAKRVNDRIGIVTFGIRAVTRVPITFDREIAQAILDRAEVGENGDATAIGHAIATAVNRLRTSQSRSRVIILVTDGVNNSGSIDPLVAAQLAAKFGIKIYTIGVGSEGAVPLPIKRQNPLTGEIETYYTTIRGELDENSLSEIARVTGGAFFRATDTRALEDVLGRIDALEKSRLTAPKSEKIEELYAGPLALALSALGLALLSGETMFMRVPA